jgi:hypothetical protein
MSIVMGLGFVFLYLILCTMIGLLGRKKVIGFWGFWVVSLILSPVAGFLLLIFFEIVSLITETRTPAASRKS